MREVKNIYTGVTPQEKANEYLSEFSNEKAIDVAETMMWYAKEFRDLYMLAFWKKVIQILKIKSYERN